MSGLLSAIVSLGLLHSWPAALVWGGLFVGAERRLLPRVSLLLTLTAIGSAALFALLPVEIAGAHAIAWLLFHSLTQPSPGRTPVLISGLLLVLAGVHSVSPLFGVALLLWSYRVATPTGSRTALPAHQVATTLALIGLIFVGTPRLLPFDAQPSPRALTGFKSHVELGTMQALLDDPTRVLEAHFSTPLTAPPYFRGVAFDHFDGRRWWSDSPRQREADYLDPLPDLVRVQITLAPSAEGVLFVPGTVEGLNTLGVAVERDRAGAYHLPGPPREVSYTAFTTGPFGVGRADPFRDAEPLIDLPKLPVEVLNLYLAHGGESAQPAARIQALSNWLRQDYAYTRLPRNTDTEAPLTTFLLTEKAGHCEYFATALATGGRVFGIPTRVINGFAGGEPTDDGVIMRRYHAHSWVEFFDGDRWITADATPTLQAPAEPGLATALTESVTDVWDALLTFDADQQLAAAAAFTSAVLPITPRPAQEYVGVGIFGLGLGLLSWRFSRRLHPVAPRPEDPVTVQLRRAQNALRRRGLAPPADLPDVEAARWVQTQHGTVGDALVELAWLSYAVRFGGEDPKPHVTAARSLADLVISHT